MVRKAVLWIALCGATQSLVQAMDPPRTWIDKDTGHRVIRLTEEAGSSGMYFNMNAYTPDGKRMVYNAPDGIHVLELATLKAQLVVPSKGGLTDYRGGIRLVAASRRENAVFFLRDDEATHRREICKANLDTRAVTPLGILPEHAGVATINADETLAAGTWEDRPEGAGREFMPPPPPPAGAKLPEGFLVQPANKGEMMERRLASRTPLVLFTFDLRNGKVTELLHSTDWINHLLFSPTDPQLLMYCHEGPWQKVDRIWTIHTDGTHNTLVHKRTMAMEIAGHEFWGADGRTVWYDWQTPKGEDFFLAGYRLESGERIAYHMQRNEWSIHFNVDADESLYAGDGGDPGQVAKAPDGEWIELFHPQMLPISGISEPGMWQPGVFHSEHLVNMAMQQYKQEPNIRFSPDKKLVIFTGNFFGPNYVFAVEVEKSDVKDAHEVQSTPELAKRVQSGNESR